MNDAESADRQNSAKDPRQWMARTQVALPKDRVKTEARTATPIPRDAQRAEPAAGAGLAEHLSVKAGLHRRLLDEMNQRDLLGRGRTIWRPPSASSSIACWRPRICR